VRYCLPWETVPRRSTRNPLRSGIYQNCNIVTSEFYIGASNNLRQRYNSHICMLRDGIHSSRLLQASYIKFGSECFVFELLEECTASPALLQENERKWINYLQPRFNNTLAGKRRYPVADDRAGMSGANFNRIENEDTKKVPLDTLVRVAKAVELDLT